MSEEYSERRRFGRLPVGVMIRVKSEEDAEAFVTNYTRDLNLGGMFLKSLIPKPVGTIVCLQLPCPDPPGYTEVYGKVVYQNNSTREGLITGMGIEFIRMEHGGRAVIQRFINGTWQDLFKLRDEPTEEVIVGMVRALLGIIDFLLNFIHGSRT